MSVTVYSRSHCPQCVMTCRLLDALNVGYEKVDIELSQSALDFVTSLGYRKAPVVVADGEHWSGFRPDLLKALAVNHEGVNAVGVGGS